MKKGTEADSHVNFALLVWLIVTLVLVGIVDSIYDFDWAKTRLISGIVALPTIGLLFLYLKKKNLFNETETTQPTQRTGDLASQPPIEPRNPLQNIVEAVRPLSSALFSSKEPADHLGRVVVVAGLLAFIVNQVQQQYLNLIGLIGVMLMWIGFGILLRRHPSLICGGGSFLLAVVALLAIGGIRSVVVGLP